MQKTLAAVIESFSDHLKFEKRYSVHTVRSYHDDLVQFRDYLEMQFGGVGINEISPAIVRSWLASLKEQGLTSRSIVRKISTLKSFFKFAVRNAVLVKSPVINIASPKTSKRLPAFVDEKDMETLFSHVEFEEGWNGLTARLAMLMLYQLGLRLSELVNCREAQVDHANNQIKILGKGNKERIIPVNRKMLAEIKGYLKQKLEKIDGADRNYLLVNEKGKKLYPKYVYRLTTKYLPQVTTVEKRARIY